MKAVNIKWDIDDGDNVSLPKEIEIPIEIEEQSEDDKDAISDYLSDITGYCHNGFGLTE